MCLIYFIEFFFLLPIILLRVEFSVFPLRPWSPHHSFFYFLSACTLHRLSTLPCLYVLLSRISFFNSLNRSKINEIGMHLTKGSAAAPLNTFYINFFFSCFKKKGWRRRGKKKKHKSGEKCFWLKFKLCVSELTLIKCVFFNFSPS